MRAKGSRPDQVVVDVNVEEKETGSLSFGASFSSSAGLGISLGFRERNFLGRGQRLAASISATDSNANYNIDFAEPAFLGRDVEFGLNFGFIETDSDFNTFDTTLGTFRPRLDFRSARTAALRCFMRRPTRRWMISSGNSGVLAAETAQGDLVSSGLGYKYSTTPVAPG